MTDIKVIDDGEKYQVYCLEKYLGYVPKDTSDWDAARWQKLLSNVTQNVIITREAKSYSYYAKAYNVDEMSIGRDLFHTFTFNLFR